MFKIFSSSAAPPAPVKPLVTHVLIFVGETGILRSIKPEDYATFEAFSAFLYTQPEVKRFAKIDERFPIAYAGPKFGYEEESRVFIGIANDEDFVLAKNGMACVRHVDQKQAVGSSFGSSSGDDTKYPYWIIKLTSMSTKTAKTAKTAKDV